MKSGSVDMAGGWLAVRCNRMYHRLSFLSNVCASFLSPSSLNVINLLHNFSLLHSSFFLFYYRLSFLSFILPFLFPSFLSLSFLSFSLFFHISLFLFSSFFSSSLSFISFNFQYFSIYFPICLFILHFLSAFNISIIFYFFLIISLLPFPLLFSVITIFDYLIFSVSLFSLSFFYN
jgi:hypothetical protein